MGVKGLKAYLNQQNYISDKATLSVPDADVKHRFVVNCSYLIHKIYEEHLDWVSAGDYYNLRRYLKLYIFVINLVVGWDGNLKVDLEEDLTLYKAKGLVVWVLDGFTPDAKIENKLARYERKLNQNNFVANENLNSITRTSNLYKDNYSKPVFDEAVLIQLLKELNQTFCIAYNPSDQVIAYLADKLNGIAITESSDMPIFNIPKGCATLSDVYFEDGLLKNVSSYSYKQMLEKKHQLQFSITLDITRSSKVANALNVSVDMLPLLATLIGNDYFETPRLGRNWLNQVGAKRYSKFTAIKIFSKYLNDKYQLLQSDLLARIKRDFLFSNGLMDKIHSSLLFYHKEFKESFQPVESMCDTKVSSLLFDRYKKGDFSYRGLELAFKGRFIGIPMVERVNFETRSSWKPSSILRHQLFYLLTGQISDGKMVSGTARRFDDIYSLSTGFKAGPSLTVDECFKGVDLKDISTLSQAIRLKDVEHHKVDVEQAIIQVLSTGIENNDEACSVLFKTSPTNALLTSLINFVQNKGDLNYQAGDLKLMAHSLILSFSILSQSTLKPSFQLKPYREPDFIRFTNTFQTTLFSVDLIFGAINFSGSKLTDSILNFLDIELASYLYDQISDLTNPTDSAQLKQVIFPICTKNLDEILTRHQMLFSYIKI